MQAQLRATAVSEDRFHSILRSAKRSRTPAQYAHSFEHYEQGNRLRRGASTTMPMENAAGASLEGAVHAGVLRGARRQGARAPDPIFIVGLPRSGSTLLEQILSSHPLVEGTMELPDIIDIARELGGSATRGETKYPAKIAELDAEQLHALGEQYLRETRIQRKTDAPFFIDKMPNNFAHIGLIHLILPRAKIIDARRHPLGCCFSGFKQHFARGQHFTYGLEEIGRYYRDYVELMAHFDAVLPGRVHRVIYEPWSTTPKTRCDGCSNTVACRSTSAACASTRTIAPCAPRVRSRCAGRSIGTASITGATTNRGSGR